MLVLNQNSLIFLYMKPLFDYLDYRKYLKDFYEDRKQHCFFFSFRFWATRLGTDPSNIAKVMQCKRHASKEFIAKFMKYAQFSKRESEYFTVLVKFTKTEVEAERRVMFEKLLSIKNIAAEKIQEHHYEFYKKWYHTAMFALLYYYKFNGRSYAELAAQLSPPISVEQAKESVALLEKLGFIFRDKDGTYAHARKLVTTGEDWKGFAIHNFQEATIQLALNSLNTHPKEVRDISSVSLTVSNEELEKIRELTKDYRKTVLEIAQLSETPDRVYHLNIQLFPMTNVPAEKGGH